MLTISTLLMTWLNTRGSFVMKSPSRYETKPSIDERVLEGTFYVVAPLSNLPTLLYNTARILVCRNGDDYNVTILELEDFCSVKETLGYDVDTEELGDEFPIKVRRYRGVPFENISSSRFKDEVLNLPRLNRLLTTFLLAES